jgi:hypothetical protein
MKHARERISAWAARAVPELGRTGFAAASAASFEMLLRDRTLRGRAFEMLLRDSAKLAIRSAVAAPAELGLRRCGRDAVEGGRASRSEKHRIRGRAFVDARDASAVSQRQDPVLFPLA